MAINKKLIHFDMTKQLFMSNANGLNNLTKPTNGIVGNIPYYSVVFLKDGYIWTHGHFINGTGIADSVSSNATISWSKITDKPSTFTPSAHTQSYTTLTGSGTTVNQAIVSSGTANGWVLKTLGSRAFDSTSYLPLAGGTLTGNLAFSGDNSITWSRNTDYAKIHFKNTGDGDSDSYLGFETADNGNEYFRFGHSSGGYTEWMSIKSDGVRVKGTKVSLEGHTHDRRYLRNYHRNDDITSTEVVNADDYIHNVGDTGGSSSTMTKPSGMDNAWGILHMHLHTGNYSMQLGFGGTTGHMYFRNAYNSSTFSSWKTLIDSDNIGSQSVASATKAVLLKPIASTTATGTSSWNIPSGCKQVWGQWFKDSTLTYTPSGGSATQITDSGDWTIWLAPNATANAATLNMRIDGTYYGSFSGNLSGNAATSTNADKLDGYHYNNLPYHPINGSWKPSSLASYTRHWGWAYNTAEAGLASNGTDMQIYTDGKFWQREGAYYCLDNGNTYVSSGIGVINGTTITQVANADTVDGYHANNVYKAASHTINNPCTSNTWIRIATITIPSGVLASAGFTAIFSNRECLKANSFILTLAIRREVDNNSGIRFYYNAIQGLVPETITIRSDDGITFYVYVESTANSWTTYYNVTKLLTEGNITYENQGTTSPISGTKTKVNASKGGNVLLADSATKATQDSDGSQINTTYLKKSGGTMTGTPYISMPGSAAAISDSQPFGITYGRIQGYSNIVIAADTDRSASEYAIITSGYDVANATKANGLAIGYNTLTWKNNTVWHAGNDGSGSGLDADLLDGKHASAFSLDGHNHDGRYLRDIGTVGTGNALFDVNIDPGVGTITYDPIAANMGTAAESNPNVTALNLGNSFARRKQLLFMWDNDNIYYRRHRDSTWTTKVKLLHTGNISPSLDINGNTIRVTTGEINSSYITVPYATNTDTVDGYHESSFLRHRVTTSTNQEGTLWSQIGIKQYNGALPDSLSGTYNWGQTITFATTDARFEIYASHLSSDNQGLYYRSGWDNDKRPWRHILDSYNSSVGKSGETLTVTINGTAQSLTNTNTWRGIQNNLTSSSTTDSLSAYQGHLLANGSARDNTKLPLTGGTMVGTISASSDAWGGGGFHNGYTNIILRGNTTTGTSGIVFSSSKGDTSINRPSDCAFIQYQPYGVSAATAVGTNPTIGTSGESGRFVIGIHNDSGDQLWLQTSAINDLKHVVGANVYTIYDTGNLPAYPTKSSWNYDDRYVASVFISGNNLRINKNGVNTDLIIPYATNADTVDGAHLSDIKNWSDRTASAYWKAGWYKVASAQTAINTEAFLTLDVNAVQSNGHATLFIRKRADSKPYFICTHNNNLNLADFRLYYNGMSMVLYARVPSDWHGRVFRIISEGREGEYDHIWTLYSNRSSTDPNAISAEGENPYINPTYSGRVDWSNSSDKATTASQVKDAGNNTAITFKYSSGGFTSNPSWLGAWNGYQLTYVSPSVLSVNYANIAGTASLLIGADNRSTNSAPSVYMSKGSASVYAEFSQSGGAASSYSGYGCRVTFTPWGDASGGRPVQLEFNNQNMYIRGASSDSAWNSWRTVIDSGNIGSQSVASAAKLTTTRTLWGQSFDGTGNVNGKITLTHNADEQLRISASYTMGANAYAHAIDVINPSLSSGEAYLYQIGRASSNSNLAYFGYVYGGDNGTSYATIGLHSHDRILNVTASDMVGIGTTTPSYKLDVNGTLHANDATTLSSTLYVGNNATIAGTLGVYGTTTLKSATTIEANTYISGETFFSAVDAFRLNYGSYGVIHRNDGGSYWILLTDKNNQDGGFNSLRPFHIDFSTGTVYMDNNAIIDNLAFTQCNISMGGRVNATWGYDINSSDYYGLYFKSKNSSSTGILFNDDGNVGIGTTSPLRKLHVIGEAIFGESGYVASQGTGSNYSGTWVGTGFMELSSPNPFIDFHGNMSTADYTSRLIQWGDKVRLKYENSNGVYSGYVLTCEGNHHNPVILGIFDLKRSGPGSKVWTLDNICGPCIFTLANNWGSDVNGNSNTYWTIPTNLLRVEINGVLGDNYTTKTTVKAAACIGTVMTRWMYNQPIVSNRSHEDIAGCSVECLCTDKAPGTNLYYDSNSPGKYIYITGAKPYGYDEGTNGLSMDQFRSTGHLSYQRVRFVVYGWLE